MTTAAPAASRLRTYASVVRFEHTLFSLPLILSGVFSVAGPALASLRWLLIASARIAASSSAGADAARFTTCFSPLAPAKMLSLEMLFFAF